MAKLTQRYEDSTEIHVGDRVHYNAQAGTVVYVIDHDEYSPTFPAEAYAHLGTGLMICFDNGALLHLERADHYLSRISP